MVGVALLFEGLFQRVQKEDDSLWMVIAATGLGGNLLGLYWVSQAAVSRTLMHMRKKGRSSSNEGSAEKELRYRSPEHFTQSA